MSAKANGSGAWNLWLITLAVLVMPTPGLAQSEEAPADSPPSNPVPTDTEATSPVVGGPSGGVSSEAAEVELKPRFELYMPSARRLASEAKRSHGGVFLAPLGGMLREMAGASAEGVDTEAVESIVKQIGSWPDTAIGAYAYAPDTEGRPRWAVRFDWPVGDLSKRIETLLTAEATAELFDEIELRPGKQDGYEVVLLGSPLAYVLPLDDGHSCLSSHADLPISTEPPTGILSTEDEEPTLVVGRLNLTGTEMDSGATFLSSFSAFTDLEYTGRVDENGDWVEEVNVHWPPIAGMGAKALFGKVKQTFFVPNEAFGAAAFKAIMAPGMLDGLAGFGQQMVMDASGQMSIVGEAGVGPIMSSIEPELCLTLLPGTGFLPMPDIVVQARTKRAKQLIRNLSEAAEELNDAFHERDKSEPWHEATVADRTVFWSDGTNQYPGMIMPLVLRPVLFTTTETDARDRKRDFLVLAWTSTSPKAFVHRWLDLPRTRDMRHLPVKRKTNGQAWLNWKQVYKWVSPYVNVPLGTLIGQVPLPRLDDVRPDMTDALVTIKLSYAGLKAHHQGPLPVGLLVLPALASASAAADAGGGSDLARERLACQRLKVLYHHSKLFKKDVGRWPAEVAELDGYVDFEGHPGLLELRLSSRKAWGKWFQELIEADDEEEDDEGIEEDVFGSIDDDVYVIEWGCDTWLLKLAPRTLEHLEELYIDQDGKLHRKKRTCQTDESEIDESGKRGDGSADASVLERAVLNIEHRYLATREPSESKKE